MEKNCQFFILFFFIKSQMSPIMELCWFDVIIGHQILIIYYPLHPEHVKDSICSQSFMSLCQSISPPFLLILIQSWTPHFSSTHLSFTHFLPLSLELWMTLCFLNHNPLCIPLPLTLPSPMTPPLCCSPLPAMFHSASLMSHLLPPA